MGVKAGRGRPFSVFANEGVCEEEQLSHDGGEGDHFFNLPLAMRRSWKTLRAGLKRAALMAAI